MRIQFYRRHDRPADIRPSVDLLDRDLWEKIPDGAQSEVLRQAEMMVKGTVAISDGANKRAATAMNVFGAGAIALFASWRKTQKHHVYRCVASEESAGRSDTFGRASHWS